MATFSYTAVTDLIFWWSGATPPRTSPNGVGRRSYRSTRTVRPGALSSASAA